MSDGENGGVDDVDKVRLLTLVVILSLALSLFTIQLLTIVIGETGGWLHGIAKLVRVQRSTRGQCPGLVTE